MKPLVICLLGPTASGKTDCAIEIAKQFPFEIISVDSTMVYRGMDIGSAKPDLKSRQNIPHYLIDILDPSESYSAGQFCKEASNAIEDIISRHKVPLLVGGTMLYFRSLQFGLSDLPNANIKIRAQLETELKEKGLNQLYLELFSVDPVCANRLHPNDTQRILRALEVYKITGKPMSDYHSEKIGYLDRYQVLNIALIPKDRVALKERIKNRFLLMLENGFIEEVKRLHLRKELHSNLPALRSVGYRQAFEYLEGKIDKETMIEKAIIATSQLAKRQLTWLRSWPEIQCFDCDSEEFMQALCDFLRHKIEQNQR